MTAYGLYERLYDGALHHPLYRLSLLALFFLMLAGYFWSWPIVAYDTDLWYHLSGGRYFWQYGAIADSAFFSYITPAKAWYDYYWLFQALVYAIFHGTGYYGLIALRCLLVLLTALVIRPFFVAWREERSGMATGALLFIGYCLALTSRELLVRPHLFSYLFIVVFLFILELKREKLWLLPVLGILWCNIHGIEYPVMILIVLSYLAEVSYQEIRNRGSVSGAAKHAKWPLILTLYAVFVTPQVTKLIQTPFTISYGNALYQQLYVAELIPIDFRGIFSFSLVPFSHLIPSFQHLLVIAAVGSFFICLLKRELRLSHAILFVSSLALLIKYNRFIYEFILLSIPVIRHTLGLLCSTGERKGRTHPRLAPLALLGILVVLPCLTYGSQFKNRPAYPVSRLNLPVGVSAFLNGLDAGGTILNEPNTGGYLQWALNKKYAIYMDMQLAIFTDRDFAFANSALQDENAFRSFIRAYDPSFLSVSLNRANFKALIGNFPEYRPVFFDDAEVLYVNERHVKKLAETQALRHIDPYQFGAIDYEKETPERLSALFTEAMRLRNIDPGCGITNTIVANILMANRQYEKALPFAQAVIGRYPEAANGYTLRADALLGLGRYGEAAADYHRTLERDAGKGQGAIYRNLHICYIRMQEYQKAYRVLAKFVNPFQVNATYRDIYELGMAAAAAGKVRDAVNFLTIAAMKLPPGDAEYGQRIRTNLRMLDPEGKKTYEQ